MRSLRLRLVLIPTVILFLGLVLACALALHRASARIRNETSSGFVLGRTLVEAMLVRAGEAPTPREALGLVASELPVVRHLDLMVIPDPGMIALGALPVMVGDRPKVPGWFAAWLLPPLVAGSVPVVADGRQAGQVVMLSNPFDELREIWNELRLLVLLLVGVSVVIVALITLTTTLALRPLRMLAEGFEALERGEFNTELPPIRVAELSRIGARFQHLALTLRRVMADNHLLIDRLISMQEAERREVAHELHDEFGPSLFAIRAELASITRWCREGEARLPEIGERARAIGGLVDGIQRTNARMLEQLRPLVLEEMGLSEALRQLVASWRQRDPAIAWVLDMDDGLDVVEAPTALTLYRLVQECLTNVTRHAEARRVEVTLRRGPEEDWLHAMVRDDGKGFPTPPRFGYGLLGMVERVRGAGGRVSVGNGAEAGAVIDAWLPWQVGEGGDEGAAGRGPSDRAGGMPSALAGPAS